MKWLTLSDIKGHIRIDGNTEDSQLTLYGTSAEDTILEMLDKTYDEIITEYGGVPTPITHAALLLTAHSYKEREAASAQRLDSVPYTIDVLIKPYMAI